MIRKLQIIQLIETDLQLLMWIFIGLRNKKDMENDNRFSKYNYGLQKAYSIDEAILERRLLYNISSNTRANDAYNY